MTYAAYAAKLCRTEQKAPPTHGHHVIVHGLKMKLALKKTFIGRIGKGFDFLGYRFGALGLTGLAQQTIDNHKQKLLLLYEQNASDQRVEEYVKRWEKWTVCGLAPDGHFKFPQAGRPDYEPSVTGSHRKAQPPPYACTTRHQRILKG